MQGWSSSKARGEKTKMSCLRNDRLCVRGPIVLDVVCALLKASSLASTQF